MKNYRDLEIYREAFELAIKIHKLSLNLPKYELYEQGSQIRRSSKSIKDNIVEGYGRRRYKMDFLKFLTYAQASCDETTSQIEMIMNIHTNHQPGFIQLKMDYDTLGRKINKFIQYVESTWNSGSNNSRSRPDTSN